MITDENVVFKTSFNYLHFMEKFCSVLGIFNFLILNCFINSESCEDMISLRTQGSICFGIYLLHQTSFGHYAN